MSSDSSTSSWTILPSEEPVVETVKPLAGGSDHQEETDASAAGSKDNNQPAKGVKCADELPVEDHLVSGENPDKDQHNSEPVAVCDVLTPSAQEISDGSVNSSEVLLDDSARLSKDLYSSSDSYTLLTPSNEDLTPSALNAEDPGGVEFVQAEESLLRNQTDPQQSGSDLHQEGEESDEPLKTDLGKQAVHLVDQLVLDLFSIWDRRLSAEAVVVSGLSVEPEEAEKKTEKVEDEEPEVRKRKSILAALEEIGRREEDEVEEEEIHPRQQEDDDSGFTVNKCILGAVILLGIGTIFFSESDYETREIKDTGKQEWLNPEVPPPQANADSSELLNKLNTGEKLISELQGQLQAQQEELDIAQKQAAEGAKEQLQMEEMKKENSRLKSEMASFSALQEENQRMKREMESIPTLQKELETLRSTLNELKLTSAPVNPPSSLSSDDPEPGNQGQAGHTEKQAKKPWHDQKQKKDTTREKHDLGEKKEKKERGRSERREESKNDWKRDEEKMYKTKEKQKQHSDEAKQWKGKDWKDKENKHRQVDERKAWKDEGKKEWIEKSRKTDWESKNERKKVKHEKENVGERHTTRDDKTDWKKGKDHLETHNSNENWKGEKEWRKVKDRSKETGRNQREWKEKGEKNKGKKDTEWTIKNDKSQGDAWKERAQRKEWESDNGKVSTWKEKKNQKNGQTWKNKKDKNEKEWKELKDKDKDWKKEPKEEKSFNRDQRKDRSHSEKQAFTDNNHHKVQHMYVDRKPSHKHNKPTIGQPEYWVHQKARLQHSPKPPQQCDSMEKCAQVEKLLPVPLAEFESILQSYLTKAVEAGVDNSKAEELHKLTTEFFKDGTFVHDQMSFEDFIEDVGDILEDMVDENGEDSAIEDEMEGFEKEVMKRFSVPEEKEKKVNGERKKEKGQVHV
ncbi:pre-B-cell leukemia homeobox interacting protein 1b isoform X2 [Gouania willdenowi]|uniref:pre-B-cell leukemia homeobox interacting protein 1b isoform X2 n=1 Tax=Gouania willdenowi TaxID=441366 RepID=UPI001056A636|nr:pre-B-cell leukemia transcription factor-interacting protein 1 isoform X2 [Gouania willdenowi]